MIPEQTAKPLRFREPLSDKSTVSNFVDTFRVSVVTSYREPNVCSLRSM